MNFRFSLHTPLTWQRLLLWPAMFMVLCISTFPLCAQTLPSLEWSTYHGGPSEDNLRDLMVDDAGNIFVIGSTQSTSGISTPGSFQPAIGGLADAYIAKFNTQGQLQWATYYGSSGNDYGQSIDLDANGNIFITGFSSSMSGFGTNGAHQTTNNGGFADAFVAKFDPNGNRVWSTFFGGMEAERSNCITVDNAGFVTIVGWTDSPANIASAGAFQPTLQGQDDIFLVRFDNDGALQWSTYYGDIGFDIGLQVDSDDAGDLFVSGWTSSTSNFVTPGAHQTVYGGGTADTYLAKFSSTGFRMWSTYYGGTIDEYGDALIVTPAGDIYIAGGTSSPNAISTAGAYQAAISGGFDTFIARFTSSGVLDYGTYYGGTGDDINYGIALDKHQYLYISGYTRSANNIASANAYQTTSNGDWDTYLVQFNPAGLREWGTYLGGSGPDQSLGIDVDTVGYVYTVGLSASTSQMTSVGSQQEMFGGGPSDGFLAKFSPCTDPVLTFNNGGYLCDGNNFVFDFTITGSPPYDIVYSLDGVIQPVIVADGSPFFYSVTTPWVDSIKLISVVSGPCQGQITGPFDYVKDIKPVSASNITIDCNQNDITYTVTVELEGGMFNYLSVGSTSGTIVGNLFTSTSLPFNQPYDLALTSASQCDTLFMTGSSGCVIDCPDDFGMIGSDVLVCAGEDVQLTASGGVGYAWTGPDNFSSSLSQPMLMDVNDNNEGLYTVIVSDMHGCMDTLSTMVSVQTVQGTIQSNDPVCVGEDIEFMATGGALYAWSGPDNFSAMTDDPVISNAVQLNAGIYTVTITDLLNCKDTVSVNVVVHDLPVAIAGSNSPLCVGADLMLTTSGGVNYFWEGPLGYNSNLQNPVTSNIPVTAAGTYTVTVTDVNGCSSTASTDVVVMNGPMLTVTPSDPGGCEGSTIQFSVSGAIAYAWSGPNGFTASTSTITINNASINDAGMYTVTGTDGNGCESMDTIQVTVSSVPVVIAGSDQPDYCEGDTVYLQVNAATSYLWTGPDGFTSTLQNPILPDVLPGAGGIYTIELNDAGCVGMGQVMISVQPSPALVLTGDTDICTYDAIMLQASGEGVDYTWIFPDGSMTSGPDVHIHFPMTSNSGLYTVTATDLDGCVSIDSVEVVVYQQPTASIMGPLEACEGEFITLTASGGQQYEWSSGAISASLSDSLLSTSAYAVTVTDGICADTATWVVNMIPLPAIAVNGPFTITPGQTIQLLASGADGYSWNPAAGLSCTDCPDPIAAPDSTTIYCVTGTSLGCEASACVTVTLSYNCMFDLPNVFSPNFDGINDVWCNPVPDCAASQTLTIFDRWGSAIFSTNGQDVCWDGTDGEETVNPGVYVYLLELSLLNGEKQIVTGDITLIK